jgi:hypothetical protein
VLLVADRPRGQPLALERVRHSAAHDLRGLKR